MTGGENKLASSVDALAIFENLKTILIDSVTDSPGVNIYFKINISAPPRVIFFHGNPAPKGGGT